MQLALILAVLAAFSISEAALAEPVADAPLRILLILAASFMFVAAAWVKSVFLALEIRMGAATTSELLDRFERWKRRHLVLWLASTVAIYYMLGWAEIVRFNWGLDNWVLLDELLILVPVVGPVLMFWSAYYEVDCALQTAAALRDKRPKPKRFLGQYLALHARHYLLLILTPVLVLFTLQDILNLAAPRWSEGSHAWILQLAPMALLLAAFPYLLRRLWRTESLPAGPLRDRLKAASQRANFHFRDILIWQTDGRLVNAAVAGFSSRLRYVFLSDGLLAQLSDEEIEAVFLHEAGHIRRRHLVLRLLLLCLPLWVWLIAKASFPGLSEQFPLWLESLGLSFSLQMGLILPAGIALYAALALGWYSRLLEHDADLWACRLSLGQNSLAPQPSLKAECFITALEKLAIENGADRTRAGWLHPSISRRVDLIRRAAQSPQFAARFQRRVALLGYLIVSGMLATAIISVLPW